MMRILMSILVLLLPVAVGAVDVAAAEHAAQPNIIFIMVDDLGPEWVGCYGAEDVQTPVLDELAAGGMRFTAAYSMPKCTPTRVTLLTGQYPFRHGWVNHWDVPRWGAGCHFDPKYNTTFANLLNKAGYATAIAGKWQINDFRVQPDILQECGFDDWCMWTGYETGNPPSGKRYWDPYIHTREGSQTYTGRFGADVFADFIIDFMRENKEKPMMIYFPMALTHGPLVHTPAEPDVTEKLEKHAAMVRYTDFIVGRLVKALDTLDIRGRTIVIFSTDNGTSGGITGHLNGRSVPGGKGSISERGCWAPFLVNCPGLVPEGVVTDCLTDFTDLLPTFCELGGTEIPADLEIDGESIAPVLLGKQKDGSREWIMAMGGGVARLTDAGRVVPAAPYAARAIRDKRFKAIVGEGGAITTVYDLCRDPDEAENLAASEDPDVVAARQKLEAAVAAFPTTDAAPRYDPTPPQPWDRKPGPKKLIDKQLARWQAFHEKPDTPIKDVWTVDKDGVLTCAGQPLGYLYTRDSYRDVLLEFEWRWPEGKEPGRGGVLLRTTGEHQIWPKSLEVQLNAGDAGDFWGLAGYELTGPTDKTEVIEHPEFGKLTNVKKNKPLEKKPGKWNRCRVRLTGDKITVEINGELANEATGCEAGAGPICFTSEGNPIEFRRIRVMAIGQ
jgi:arylsulfatase A-like enzyme